MKNKSILLFILIIIVVALLGVTHLWAGCTTDELEKNLCIDAYGYAVRVFPEGGNWPIVDPVTGIIEFRYMAVVDNVSECKSATWNYFVQDLTACTGSQVDYIIYTDPPGAQLLLPGDTIPKCTEVSAAVGHNLIKLNPSLNCGEGNQVVFSFYAAPGTPTSLCNNSVVVTKKGCEGGYLLGPGCGVSGFIEDQTFNCGDDSVYVQYDKCSGEPIQVTMINVPGACSYIVSETTYGENDYPKLKDDNDATYEYEPKHMGPGGVGAAFCMEPPPPIYFYNQKAWYGGYGTGEEICHLPD